MEASDQASSFRSNLAQEWWFNDEKSSPWLSGVSWNKISSAVALVGLRTPQASGHKIMSISYTVSHATVTSTAANVFSRKLHQNLPPTRFRLASLPHCILIILQQAPRPCLSAYRQFPNCCPFWKPLDMAACQLGLVGYQGKGRRLHFWISTLQNALRSLHPRWVWRHQDFRMVSANLLLGAWYLKIKIALKNLVTFQAQSQYFILRCYPHRGKASSENKSVRVLRISMLQLSRDCIIF